MIAKVLIIDDESAVIRLSLIQIYRIIRRAFQLCNRSAKPPLILHRQAYIQKRAILQRLP